MFCSKKSHRVHWLSFAILTAMMSSVHAVAQQQPPQQQMTPEQYAEQQRQLAQQIPADKRVPVTIMSPEQAAKEGVAQLANQPFPALDAAQLAYLDQVLSVWEKRTSDIKQYECVVQRWQYADQPEPETISKGVLKYMQPDKGLFKIDEMKSISARVPKAEYQVDPRNPMGEYWICDGEWVHIMDRNNKKAERYQLPPQLQGAGIYRSPLPFLFGVKAAEIKNRYWIRPVKPPPGDDSVWLEAWPKWADDAGNYSRVQVVLDKKDVLPRGLIVFLPQYREEAQHREIYEFSDRKEGANLLDKMKAAMFQQEFIPTKLPSDWTVIEEPYIPPQDAVGPGQGSPNPTPGRVAQPPAATQQRR